MTRALIALAAASLSLAACAGDAEPPQAQTVTETATVTSTTTTTAPAPTPTSTPTPSANALLEATWDMQDAQAQEDMCWGWSYDEEFVLDTLFSTLDETVNITRADAREFFERKCG